MTLFDNFLMLITIRLGMSFEANGPQALAKGVRRQTEPAKNSRLNCVVAQKVLAIELTPLSKPRLVMISANSLVELTRHVLCCRLCRTRLESQDLLNLCGRSGQAEGRSKWREMRHRTHQLAYRPRCEKGDKAHTDSYGSSPCCNVTPKRDGAS